jgi:succinoglycan biosynthesis transport protein ExoP
MNQLRVVNSSAAPAMPGQPMPPFAPVQVGLSAESKLALLEYWRSITQHKWAILGLATVIAVLAGAVAFAMTPVYRSTATVLIEANKAKILSFDDMLSGMGMQAKEHYQTQVEILKSRDVALKTAQALKIWNLPEFDPRKGEEGLGAKAMSLIGIRPAISEWPDEKLANFAVRKLMDNTSVEPVRLSQLVKVHFESTDRDLAMRAANELATQYINADRDARFKQAQNLNGWLEQRATELRDKVAQSETALQKYREQQGLVNLAGSAQTLAGKQVDGVNQRMVEVRSRRLQLESAYEGINANKSGDYSNVPAVVNSLTVQGALQREADATRQAV